MSEYWTICIECALDEAGIESTSEQRAAIAETVKRAHEEYGSQHGHHEADRGLVRMAREEAKEKMLQFIADQMGALDAGSNFFDRLNSRQKDALARLTCARKELARVPA